MTNTVAGPSPSQTPVQSNGNAKASLILGIVSVFFNPLAIATVLGIVFGVRGLRRAPALGGRGKAVAGIVLSVVGFFVGIAVFASLVSGAGRAVSSAVSEAPAASLPAASAPDSSSAEDSEAAAPSETPEPAEPSEPAVPAEYAAALVKAQQYNDSLHFSKARLLTQLTSSYGEEFSKKAGTYAVDHVKANWNANALIKAKEYRDQQAMSTARIRNQLSSSYGEQFTKSQTDYAIAHLND